ncbi:conserved hypothetical protein [Oenococcus oeni]|uniref:DUF1934 domain-containing protein n=1 Tax=Oenococcus oeni TaxID=1247 RepID=UPI0010B4B179|nr:DUF1934 domain-containing protein [Oenococcus oeni]SYW06032.1 conserved hypothetical protein [Oenococcus oeni]
MMRDSFKSAINIKIASKIDQAGEQQTVNQAVQGDLLLNEDHSYTILYKMENHLIRLEVAPEKNRVVYFGHGGRTVLVYDEKIDLAESKYASDQGIIDMLVKTENVDFDQVDATGSLHIEYELFQDKDSLGKFDLTLQFSPTVSKID